MQRRSVPTSNSGSKSRPILLIRQDDEKNIRQFISEETRALLISLIRFDNELQKYYNLLHQAMLSTGRQPRRRRI